LEVISINAKQRKTADRKNSKNDIPDILIVYI